MTRPDLPGPMRRRGPRPLALMLTGRMPASNNCSTASNTSSAAWPSWNGADAALIRGIAAYRRHPWRRDLPEPPPVWAEGGSRVLDYGGAQAGTTVLFVPSLVNRAHILDLMQGHSMLRWLAVHGVRPLLLDWGWPGPLERGFTLTDYAAGRLGRALAALGPVVLAGYCMGGMLAVAAALQQPAAVRGLVLLATPWDFGQAPDAASLAAALPALEPQLQLTGTLPVDTLQALLTGPDMDGIAAKYRAFGAIDQASPAAQRFVAIEDWLNDGVPLAAPVAREALGEWYGANTPGRGEWRVGGAPVRPERLALPCFVAVPGQDRIVPPASALALAGMIPGAVLHRAASGHIGMAAGPRAQAGLWAPLLEWLADAL